MKFKVFLWSLLLFVGTGSLTNAQDVDEKTVEESNELKQLYWDFSDATEKWNSLYERFEKIQDTGCTSSANEALCRSIQEQVRNIAAKKEGEELDEGMKFVGGILSSIQEKVDRLDRKMESGVGGSPITTRDYINAMKGLERRLQNFQMAIMNLGRDVRLPMKYVEASEDDSLIEIDRPERSSGRNYDYDDITGIKHLAKTCKLLIGPYKKLLGSVDRLEEIFKDVNSKSIQRTALYKNSAFKDIKDMLEDISDDIKSLRKMSSREMNENEKILKKINKKLEKELKDDDKDDEKLKKSLKGFMIEQRRHIEKLMKKEMSKLRGDKDTDDDDTDDDDDDDTDTTDDSREKERRKSKDDTDSDDDDDDGDDDDSCNDSDGCRKKKGKDTDDSDDDDDDDDDYKKKGKKDDDDDDDTDSDDDDDDDDDDKRGKGKKKKNRENLTKKYSDVEEMNTKDVEVLKNSAAGTYKTQKFIKSLLGIPPYN